MASGSLAGGIRCSSPTLPPLCGTWCRGLELPVLCLGAGCFFYALVCISILQSSHLATPAENYKGQPALFLGE